MCVRAYLRMRENGAVNGGIHASACVNIVFAFPCRHKCVKSRRQARYAGTCLMEMSVFFFSLFVKNGN